MTFPPPDISSGYLATAAAFAAVVVGVMRWRALGRGQRLAATWLGASVTADLAIYIVTPLWHNTQPIVQLWFLVSTVLGLEVLASLQSDRRIVTIFRAFALAYALLWGVLLLTVESFLHYSTFIGPLQGVLLLGGGLAALLRRVALGRWDLLADPAFLISVAIAAIGLVGTFQTLTAQLLLREHNGFVTGYYTLNNLVSVLGALLILTALNLPGYQNQSSAA